MVRDNVTRLIWEMKNNKDDKADYSNPHDADNEYTWYDSNPATNGGNAGTQSAGKDTESFLKALNDSNYGGYNDWRLPAIKELASIVHFGNYNPAINTTYFPNTAASWYWSSTTSVGYTGGAWFVYFDYGYVNSHGKGNAGYVRAVRGGQSGVFGDWIIGALAGLQQPSVPAQQPLELQVNSTNARRDTPVHQWLLYTTIINGAQSPLYLMSDRGTYELTNDVLTHSSNYTFTFDKDDVTPISSLTMSSMGLKAGDHFVYGYAYMNEASTIFIDNVVTIDVK